MTDNYENYLTYPEAVKEAVKPGYTPDRQVEVVTVVSDDSDDSDSDSDAE